MIVTKVYPSDLEQDIGDESTSEESFLQLAQLVQ